MASCAPSSHRSCLCESRAEGRGRSQGMLWNSPSSVSLQGGVLVMVEAVPCPCAGTLPVPRSFSERDQQLRLHLFNVHTGRELGGPFCFSWISIR